MSPEQEKLAREYDDQVVEFRRNIAIWQTHIRNARPSDAANLQDQIAIAEAAITELEARKSILIGETL